MELAKQEIEGCDVESIEDVADKRDEAEILKPGGACQRKIIGLVVKRDTATPNTKNIYTQRVRGLSSGTLLRGK